MEENTKGPVPSTKPAQREPIIRDFDRVVPEKRQARIGRRVVDVTRIPSRVALEMARFADNPASVSNEEGFLAMVNLVARVCQGTDKTITTDWLIDNSDIVGLLDFVNFVLSPLKERAERGNASPAKS